MNVDLAQEVRAAAQSLSAAIVSNDVTRISPLLAAEWRLVDEDGVSSREQFLDVVASGALTHSRMYAVGDIEVRVYGDVAVTFARVVNTAHFGGETFEADEWTTDVFVKVDEGWVCAHSHVTPASD